jgi:hypothetical protein
MNIDDVVTVKPGENSQVPEKYGIYQYLLPKTMTPITVYNIHPRSTLGHNTPILNPLLAGHYYPINTRNSPPPSTPFWIDSQKTFSQWRISDIYFGDEWLQLENISIELQTTYVLHYCLCSRGNE